MKKILPVLMALIVSFSLTHPVIAATTPKKNAPVSAFKKNNPDGHKYEFGRSYISSLSYFYSINERWAQQPPKKQFPDDDIKVIRLTIEYFVRDNTELRIAKNYMTKYMTIPNPLMQKVADTMIDTCNRGIILNNDEKKLWQAWLEAKVSGKATPAEEKNFIAAQQKVEMQRKEVYKALIQASSLMTKVLLSETNANEKGRVLALTAKERARLLDQLDTYGKNVLDWGLKPGQSTLQASVAVIREVLEDSVYVTRK